MSAAPSVRPSTADHHERKGFALRLFSRHRGCADHWRAEVLNVSGNDALQAAYRGCKRRSNYWTRSDTVACLDYASLLALKWCPAGRRILAGVGALRGGIGVSGFWGLDGFRCSNRRRAVVAPPDGVVRDGRAGFCRPRFGT